MANSKHFIIYYQKGTGTLVVTEPRPWARENQTLFPKYNFSDKDNDHPRSHEVIEELNRHGFVSTEFEDVKITFNFDKKIDKFDKKV